VVTLIAVWAMPERDLRTTLDKAPEGGEAEPAAKE
jgi:hypothetical protein